MSAPAVQPLHPVRPAHVPRVLAVATHPIQYQAPWFRGLARSSALELQVCFIQRPDAREQGAGFGVAFEWDIPLLDGYAWGDAPDVRGRGGLRGFFATHLAHPVRFLREQRPDLLLLTGWHAWPLLQLLLAAWWLGIPVLMRGESNDMRPRTWKARLMHRLLLARCGAFLSIGEGNRRFYQRYGVVDSRLFDAPYFIDNQRFTQSAAELAGQRDALRARWGLPVQGAVLVYVGKLEPKKRILDLLQALQRMQGTAHLLVVGTGELMAAARERVDTQGLPVRFAGFLNQSEIAAAYVAADALVLPSDAGETWGLVVNEAMACGRPAIVSDHVGCGPDLITPGQTGWSFPLGDVDALARALDDAVSDLPRLVQMGQQAHARVARGYSVERAVAGVEAAVAFLVPPGDAA